MKIKLLIAAGLFSLVSVAAFAQKGEVSNAQQEYDKYEQLKINKAMAKLAENSITAAKTSIDKASTNNKTSALPLTHALKAAIYVELAMKDTVPSTSTPLFTTAEEALKKAKELDTKGENKALTASRSLAQYQLNKGVKEYQDKKYDLAYKSFDYYRTIMPEDTNAIYYTGLAAANSQNWDAAIANYNKLVTTNFSQKQRAYSDLSNFYLAKKDTAGAVKVMTEASAKYPNDANLSKRLIELNLQMGKKDEVLANIQKAIANDPKNKTLYYYAGVTYTQVAEEAAKKIASAKTPADKATLQKSKDDNMAKAVEMYKKALEVDPDYFEANLNLGYVLITPAIEIYNAANKLPVSKQKEYNAEMAKANVQFDAAKPYLQKAVDLNPKSVDALTNLKTYYLGKKDITNANKIKQQIDALNGGAAPANK